MISSSFQRSLPVSQGVKENESEIPRRCNTHRGAPLGGSDVDQVRETKSVLAAHFACFGQHV